MSTSAPELTPLEEKFLEQIDARLSELEDAKSEYDRLTMTRQRLAGGSSTVAASGGASNRTPSRPVGRRAPQGNRQEEFLAIVTAQPGITIPQAAKAMDCAANYLYRVRDKAKVANQIRVEGQQLYPVEEGTPDPARVREIEAAGRK